MRCELEEKLGREEEVRSEIEMSIFGRWRFDASEKQRLRHPICRLIVG